MARFPQVELEPRHAGSLINIQEVEATAAHEWILGSPSVEE